MVLSAGRPDKAKAKNSNQFSRNLSLTMFFEMSVCDSLNVCHSDMSVCQRRRRFGGSTIGGIVL